MFAPYLDLWDLVPDGAPIATHAGRLLPVRRNGVALMLKVSTEADEKAGGALMSWWDGHGAARVAAMHDDAILLERAEGERSLSAFARDGRDDEATHILCETIATLHAPRSKPLPELVPLSVWFRQLEPAARTHGGVLAQAAETARDLLASPQEVGVLHGDVHHDNVLDFGARGWLAIDPKRLFGERGFEYAILFCDPDIGDPACKVATIPERFTRRLDIVVAQSGLQRERLLQWIIAWTGLSAAWFIGDGDDPAVDLAVSALATAPLDR